MEICFPKSGELGIHAYRNSEDPMFSSTSALTTFGPLLNNIGHRGLKKGMPHSAPFKNVFAHNRTISSSSSTSYANKAIGGIPRFYSEQLPASKDKTVRVDGDESRHMTKVLRLGVNDRVELFNGQGGIVEGRILRVDRTGVYIVAVEEPVILTPSGAQWHVAAAFGTLKGGRADWLIEKCTELGASTVTPLLTERSTLISENRVDRWQRVMLAALKQLDARPKIASNDGEAPSWNRLHFTTNNSIKLNLSGSGRGNSSR